MIEFVRQFNSIGLDLWRRFPP